MRTRPIIIQELIAELNEYLNQWWRIRHRKEAEALLTKLTESQDTLTIQDFEQTLSPPDQFTLLLSEYHERLFPESSQIPPRWQKQLSTLSAGEKTDHLEKMITHRSHDPKTVEIIQYLLENGARPKNFAALATKENEQMTDEEASQIANSMLQFQTKIKTNGTSANNKFTPLHHAAKNNKPRLFEKLLKAGFDPEKKSAENMSAMQLVKIKSEGKQRNPETQEFESTENSHHWKRILLFCELRQELTAYTKKYWIKHQDRAQSLIDHLPYDESLESLKTILCIASGAFTSELKVDPNPDLPKYAQEPRNPIRDRYFEIIQKYIIKTDNLIDQTDNEYTPPENYSAFEGFSFWISHTFQKRNLPKVEPKPEPIELTSHKISSKKMTSHT